ncbi:MAG: hypothetical protein ACO1SX_14495 [Actinomycetota bacterium]
MQQDIDWRHLAGAVVLLGLLVFAGFQIANRSPEPPRAPAVAGPNARMQDAPEHPATTAGSGLPTAR